MSFAAIRGNLTPGEARGDSKGDRCIILEAGSTSEEILDVGRARKEEIVVACRHRQPLPL
jgi:hypothetical protein